LCPRSMRTEHDHAETICQAPRQLMHESWLRISWPTRIGGGEYEHRGLRTGRRRFFGHRGLTRQWPFILVARSDLLCSRLEHDNLLTVAAISEARDLFGHQADQKYDH